MTNRIFNLSLSFLIFLWSVSPSPVALADLMGPTTQQQQQENQTAVISATAPPPATPATGGGTALTSPNSQLTGTGSPIVGQATILTRADVTAPAPATTNLPGVATGAQPVSFMGPAETNPPATAPVPIVATGIAEQPSASQGRTPQAFSLALGLIPATPPANQQAAPQTILTQALGTRGPLQFRGTGWSLDDGSALEYVAINLQMVNNGIYPVLRITGRHEFPSGLPADRTEEIPRQLILPDAPDFNVSGLEMILGSTTFDNQTSITGARGGVSAEVRDGYFYIIDSDSNLRVFRISELGNTNFQVFGIELNGDEIRRLQEGVYVLSITFEDYFEDPVFKAIFGFDGALRGIDFIAGPGSSSSGGDFSQVEAPPAPAATANLPGVGEVVTGAGTGLASAGPVSVASSVVKNFMRQNVFSSPAPQLALMTTIPANLEPQATVTREMAPANLAAQGGGNTPGQPPTGRPTAITTGSLDSMPFTPENVSRLQDNIGTFTPQELQAVYQWLFTVRAQKVFWSPELEQLVRDVKARLEGTASRQRGAAPTGETQQRTQVKSLSDTEAEIAKAEKELHTA